MQVITRTLNSFTAITALHTPLQIFNFLHPEVVMTLDNSVCWKPYNRNRRYPRGTLTSAFHRLIQRHQGSIEI
jgi:hypothetical protein